MLCPHPRRNSTGCNLPPRPIPDTPPCELAPSWAETTMRSPRWFHSQVSCCDEEQEVFSQRNQIFSTWALTSSSSGCIFSWLHDTTLGLVLALLLEQSKVNFCLWMPSGDQGFLTLIPPEEWYRRQMPHCSHSSRNSIQRGGKVLKTPLIWLIQG